MKKSNGQRWIWVALALAGGLLLIDRQRLPATTATIPYSSFEDALREGRIASVTVGDRTVTGQLKTPGADGSLRVAAQIVEPAIAERLSRFGVPYAREFDSTWLGNLTAWLLPLLLLVALWSATARRLADGGGTAALLGIGRSKAKVDVEKRTGVTFDDVAGVDEAKAELQEVVEFLKDPKEHGRLGARIPKGVLLMGPTGTGKTLLARAVAGEAGVAFFSISGSAFIEMFVGVGAARVRDLFEQARAQAPAIIFIDELDALGKARAAMPIAGGFDEREQTLNQLLVELDGFDPSVGVVLLAATNRPELLDPALLRAGRFDRQVLVDRPDRRGRLAILQVHARKIRTAPDLDLAKVAAITVGLAGADLANVVNEAALCATRRKGDNVTLDDFNHAVERVVAGVEKKTRVLTPRERRIVAHHETGHALTALALPGADAVHKVSIVPHGIGALGYTMQRPSEDRRLFTRGELLDRIAVLLGGRAAEQLVFDDLSTGAADDIAKATDIARDMVVRYGMDDGLGPVSHGERRLQFLDGTGAASGLDAATSPDTAQRIDAAVQRIVEAALQRATALLRRHRATLDRCALTLIERETLDEADLRTLAADLLAPAAPTPATAVDTAATA